MDWLFFAIQVSGVREDVTCWRPIGSTRLKVKTSLTYLTFTFLLHRCIIFPSIFFFFFGVFFCLVCTMITPLHCHSYCVWLLENVLVSVVFPRWCLCGKELVVAVSTACGKAMYEVLGSMVTLSLYLSQLMINGLYIFWIRKTRRLIVSFNGW